MQLIKVKKRVLKVNQEEMEAYNQANIIALNDIISKGAGALIKIISTEQDRNYRLEAGDIERAKRTILNLSQDVTHNDVMEVSMRISSRRFA
jgi:trehalose-6-phosphatase